MGIITTSQFSQQAALPLDDRTVVVDITARDAIASGRRYDGLVVYVEATNENWQLQGGITNADWVLFGTGGGSGGTLYIDQTPDNGTYGLLAGSVNGSNALFTVSQGAYLSGNLTVYRNGFLQLQGASDDWVETTPASGTFTFNTAPLTGDIITVQYGSLTGSITLKTNGTNNSSQSTLNLVAGTNITLTDGGAGAITIDASGSGAGTVIDVAALTLGTTGTDLSSSVANGTTTPVITLNVPTASATNRGVLSSTDWSTFNDKQGAISLTTIGTSGAATLIGTTLNIPQYTGGSGTVTSVGLSLPSIFSVSGSPVTTSGTLTGTLATQTANIVFAGPASGAAAAPTFRALVGLDIPVGVNSPISVVNTSSLFSRATGVVAGTSSAATNSIFLGNNAGNNATNASLSNFFGQNAGASATSAIGSNFFGRDAGNGATNAVFANFLGVNAGLNGVNAQYGNFLGIQAGENATNAEYSNFLGAVAGQNATGANNSNFFGQNAGNGASGASGSNFIGNSAGNSATSAASSNFIGNNAGNSATSASNSNFFGTLAGFQATSATNSNFFGQNAGLSANSASNSTFIGFNTGRFFTGNNLGSNNIIIGTNISLPNARTNSFNIGGVLFGINTYATTTGNPSILPTATGSIGIGTSTPSTARLVIADTALAGSGSLAGGVIDLTQTWNTSGNPTAIRLNVTNTASGATANLMDLQVGGVSQFKIDKNGNVGVGITSAVTAHLHLPAGSATAGTAPIKLTTGTALTTPEDGTLEYHTSHLYFTIGSTRYQLDQQGGGSSPITVVNTSSLFSTATGVVSGTGSTATNSIFLGINSGNSANVFNSNFVGNSAGENATSASNSNFFGNFAGNTASSASNSNFLGNQAGFGATSASQSNFFGNLAGRDATGANNSNFMGLEAGRDATSATYSNFFGAGAGQSATSASHSNFFGLFAGNSATSATNSNFFGNLSGFGATNASYSTLFGYQVGQTFGANNLGSNNIIIGTNISLPNATANSINFGGVLFAKNTYATTTGNPSIAATATGSIGVGVLPASITARLHLPAGTATASTAPLKLTSGTNMTTPEDGAFEFDGTNLYFTVGGVRKTVTLV